MHEVQDMYLPRRERERQRKIERRNKIEKGLPRKNERKMRERKDGLEHLRDKQMDRRKWNEREKATMQNTDGCQTQKKTGK